jgi:16S rRNA (cytidine1402-2'-O)-methyltransferase
MGQGRLSVVATPIGNLADLSPRAAEALAAADRIAAEDTRHTGRLLKRHGIERPLVSYHEHNERQRAAELTEALDRGETIALVSDAGTPGVSDPGYRLVRAAHERGVPVIAVPGPSAAVAALSVSGLPSDRFMFHGFFPRKEGAAARALEEVEAIAATHIFYESPARLTKTLRKLAVALPGCEVAVCRELTKLHEEVRVGAPAGVLAHYETNEPRGECVLVLWAPDRGRGDALSDDALRADVERRMREEGLSRRDAIRAAAAELGVPRNRVYAASQGEQP